MTQRYDISVKWELSPRLITIYDPSTEIVIQDLHDTLRELEQRIGNMIYPALISTAGKEDLGGGVSVGLTATLLNAQINFEARYIRTSSGTSDISGTPDTIIFTDSGASFISNGVERGATITNFDDQSFATVVSVLSETSIRHEPSQDGYTNSWSIGDEYKIHNEVQCEITGGNLVAIDGYGNNIDPISPTAFVQIVRTSASSATNQNSQDIQHAAYIDGICVDITSSYSLSTAPESSHPIGTARAPVNNMTDALIIANYRGVNKFHILKSMTIDSGGDYSEKTFFADSPAKVTTTVTAAAYVENCEFEYTFVKGILDGGNTLQHCTISDLNYVNGYIKQCLLEPGTIELGGTSPANILDCWSGATTPTNPSHIDMASGTGDLIVRGFNGVMQVNNKTNPATQVTIDLDSGLIILDATCTRGPIRIRGVGTLVNNSSVPADELFIEDMINSVNIAQAVWSVDLSNYAQAATMGGAQLLTAYLSEYGFAIHYSSDDGYSGTIIGENGTQRNPSNNIADLIIIATELNLKTIVICDGTIILPSDMLGWQFYSTDPTNTLININGKDVSHTTFYRCQITGDFGDASTDTAIIATNCAIIGTCTNLTGRFMDTGFGADITLGYSSITSVGVMFMVNCKNIAPTVIHMDAAYQQSIIGNSYNGILTIDGCDNSSSTINLSFMSGELLLPDTNIDGYAVIAGSVVLTDNSGVGFTVDESRISASILLDHNTAEHTENGTVGKRMEDTESAAKLNTVLLLDKS